MAITEYMYGGIKITIAREDGTGGEPPIAPLEIESYKKVFSQRFPLHRIAGLVITIKQGNKAVIDAELEPLTRIKVRRPKQPALLDDTLI